MVRDAGATEVYLASTSPPLIAPCPYGVDMASKTEFVATGRNNDEIAEELGADHLLYLDRDLMNECGKAGNEKIEDFCNACFTGEYPTGDITAEGLQSMAGDRCKNRGETLTDETASVNA
jgi:amidophosphoribosyltransferase